MSWHEIENADLTEAGIPPVSIVTMVNPIAVVTGRMVGAPPLTQTLNPFQPNELLDQFHRQELSFR
jgi:hypothetical protein